MLSLNGYSKRILNTAKVDEDFYLKWKMYIA